jgi:hypothetical protein
MEVKLLKAGALSANLSAGAVLADNADFDRGIGGRLKKPIASMPQNRRAARAAMNKTFI